MLKAIDYFYYVNGYFPTDDNLVTAQKSTIPSFIQADKEYFFAWVVYRWHVAHFSLYRIIMCAKNSIVEQAELSWNAMSEFYHDL